MGSTMSQIVTCQPRRRRKAWRRAINEKSVAVMSEKVRCVISHLVLLQPLGAKVQPVAVFYPSSVSGSGQEALQCLFPLSRLLFCAHGLGRPGKGQVDRRADEENDTLVKTRFLDLLVEFECLSGEMPTHVAQYQVVAIGL